MKSENRTMENEFLCKIDYHYVNSPSTTNTEGPPGAWSELMQYCSVVVN